MSSLCAGSRAAPPPHQQAMASRTILEFPDPRLRTRAQPVSGFDAALGTLIDDLLETMYGASGIGLAATQVDVHQRVIVIDVSAEHNQPLVLVNPQILAREGAASTEEGCLSVPGIFDAAKRAGAAAATQRGRGPGTAGPAQGPRPQTRCAAGDERRTRRGGAGRAAADPRQPRGARGACAVAGAGAGGRRLRTDPATRGC